MARATRYGVEARRMFDRFDAWVATETVPCVEDGRRRRPIRRREYDAPPSRTLSEAAAECRARQPMRTYGAVMP